MLGVVEALLYAHKSGLDLTHFIDTIKTGGAGSKALEKLAPRIVAGDFAPGFYVEHFVKDMAIALDECAKMNLCLPGLALVRQFYTALVA
jgi:3-hydroxyisobutyrate dehydrogenase